MTEPISDKKLAELRNRTGLWPGTSTQLKTNKELLSLIARIDLERKRGDRAERLNGEAADAIENSTRLMRAWQERAEAAEAEVARLRADSHEQALVDRERIDALTQALENITQAEWLKDAISIAITALAPDPKEPNE